MNCMRLDYMAGYQDISSSNGYSVAHASLDPKEQISVKLQSNNNIFLFTKMQLKMLSAKLWPFLFKPQYVQCDLIINWTNFSKILITDTHDLPVRSRHEYRLRGQSLSSILSTRLWIHGNFSNKLPKFQDLSKNLWFSFRPNVFSTV